MAKEIKNPNAEAVVEAVSKTEKFFNENGKIIAGIAAGIVVAAIVVFCWFKFAYQPAVAEAQGQKLRGRGLAGPPPRTYPLFL